MKELSFFRFLAEKEQKYQLIIFFCFYAILYGVMIYLYPFPAGISDSGAYVKAASVNTIDTYRPFGYSEFLISLHKISSSIHFVVFAQYVINLISSILLIFSIKYLFRPVNKLIFYLYAFFTIFSPLAFYLSNSILSDSIFSSLTLLWILSSIWMIRAGQKFNRYVFFVLHVIILIYLITFRYTGLIYVPISVALIFFTFRGMNRYLRLALSIVPVIIVAAYYKDQKIKVLKVSLVETFSGFSGWQSANNALHCLPYARLDPKAFRDKEVRDFTEYLVKNDAPLYSIRERPTARFMWDNNLPLKQYMFSEMQRKNVKQVLEWNYLGSRVYNKFGSFVRLHFPLIFTRRFIIPNCRLILFPDQDQVIHNYRNDGIPGDLLSTWFGTDDSKKIVPRSNIYARLFILIPIARLIIWILLICSFILLLAFRRVMDWKEDQKYTFRLLAVFIVIYYAFSAYAGPFELRYSAPLHALQTTMIFIVTHCLCKHIRSLQKQKSLSELQKV